MLLRDGGALKLTTARYLTPSGYDLAKRGLPPSVKVVDDPATAARRGAAARPRPGGGPGMSRGGPATVLVAELVSAGRGAAAQPAFEPGPRIPLAKGARGGADVGDLVTVDRARPRRPVTAVHGPVVVAARGPAGAAGRRGRGAALPARRRSRRREELDEGDVAGDRGRRDLRDQRVVTIDPEGAKDHDDAIAVAPEDGRRDAPVGAHRRRLALRRRRRRRSTARRRGAACSVYVPGMVTPMLPAAPVVGPVQPARRRRPRRGHGRDGGRPPTARWARRASRAR